ncbi:MAG: ABC transporter permease [Candidatus Caldarchaeum sp.]|nr:ABC transporter permease [Candidatus Caldarchaeum sp.]
MSFLRTFVVKAATLVLVLLTVLLLVVVVLGYTGVSDRILAAYVNEELRTVRQSLSQRIKDPVELEAAVEQVKKELWESYGLDRPWYERIPAMVFRVLFLDLGYSRTITSFAGSRKVADIIAERIPYTILLVTTAVVISAFVGINLGMRAAYRRGKALDKAVVYLAAASYALPSWWTGLILILIFYYQLRLFPSGGLYSAPPPTDPFLRFFDLLWHAFLPVLTLVIIVVGGWAYVSRTIVLNIVQEDFVQVAKAKGLPDSLIRSRYVLRPAAPPIATNIVFAIAGSIGGAILTETVFNWPGMGRLYYEAISAFDEGLVVALTFIYTVIYVAARFIIEILIIALDPRVRV